ncbi:MAG: methyltransferase [Kangiellaceae bacterium]|nr:methyltransferase [Kangiellaceae bacterium]
MSNPSLDSQLNGLTLHRYPQSKDQSLRAWSAADEYLLDHLAEEIIPKNSRILIINDQFGALSCSLSRYPCSTWTDSFLSKTAIEKNLNLNDIESADIDFINQCNLSIPNNRLFDLIVIRVPKHNSLLEFQLAEIKPFLSRNCKVISAGMSKDIHKSNLKLFERIIGPTKTSLARKKARLIFSEVLERNDNINEIRPMETSFQLSKQRLNIIGMPGVFSRKELDIGSRVLLDHLPETRGKCRLVDLGCGTGVLGTLAAKQNQQLEVTFTDESYLAVESARRTFHFNRTEELAEAHFIVTDVLDGLNNHSYDYVLCNPPFHQQNVQTLSIANKMFKESAKKLTDDGELYVVANRHLKYRPMLSSFFKQVEIISNDSKFIVWRACIPKR